MMNEKIVGYCQKCAPKHCPFCGSELVVIKYSGHKPEQLALMAKPDFRYFVGCLHYELHDKVVNGVDCWNKVFVVPILRGKRR
jgi:hypothetical protein